MTPSIELIQSSVARYFGIERKSLRVTTKDPTRVRIRQIAMYLTRSLNRGSFPEIAAAYGGLDHTTVLYAYRKIEKRIPADQELVSDIYAVQALIKDSYAKNNPEALVGECPHCGQFWVDPDKRKKAVNELREQVQKAVARLEMLERAS